MKAEIHPNYHTITVVMDRRYGVSDPLHLGKEGDKLNLDIDSKSHRPGPAAPSRMSIAAAACPGSRRSFRASSRRTEVSNLVISAQKSKRPCSGAFLLGVQPHPVIARSKATKQSILALPPYGIASRSLSSGAHSRDRWLAMRSKETRKSTARTPPSAG